MKKLKIIIFLITSFTLTLVGIEVLSADFQKGLTAYNNGDYATAMSEFKPLAEQGDRVAQHNLGVMYHNGEGVSLNYKTAIKWFTLSAEQGYVDSQLNLKIVKSNLYTTSPTAFLTDLTIPPNKYSFLSASCIIPP